MTGNGTRIMFKEGVVAPPRDVMCSIMVAGFWSAFECAVSQVGAYVTVTDWYRTEATNVLVGGVPGSKHTLGLAVDLRLGPDASNVAALWTAAGLDAVLESDHWHLEWDGPALRAPSPA